MTERAIDILCPGPSRDWENPGVSNQSPACTCASAVVSRRGNARWNGGLENDLLRWAMAVLFF